MDTKLWIEHIRLMLQKLDASALRAVYMIVRELYTSRKPD